MKHVKKFHPQPKSSLLSNNNLAFKLLKIWTDKTKKLLLQNCLFQI